MDCVASTVACDVFSAGVLVALLLRELEPNAFSHLGNVLGEEDLYVEDVVRLQHGLECDTALPATVKELLAAALNPSPTSRLSARRILSSAFLSVAPLPSTPASFRKDRS